MSDCATIEIDCDSMHVTARFDQMDSVMVSRTLEITHAALIVQILAPRIRELMTMSKPQLMRLHLEQLQGQPERKEP